MARWSEEQKIEAVTIAHASGAAEAARATGISAGTIRSWMSREKKSESETVATDAGVATVATQRSAKTRALAEQATARAVERAADQIADITAEAASDILGLIQSSVRLIETTMKNGPNSDESKAGWLRALVGVMAQSVEKYQLLTGKPTSRQAVEGQVTQEYVYDITQRVIQQQPGLIDSIFTQDTGSSLEDRGGQGAPARLGQLR